MKKHISITIDEDVIRYVEKLASSCRRSVSQVLELAAVEYLRERMTDFSAVPSTPASFRGTFSRADTYAGRS
jgi:predicted transcriptional regulator